MGGIAMLAGGVVMAAAGGAFAAAAAAAVLQRHRLDALARRLREATGAALRAKEGWDDAVRRVRAGAAPETMVVKATPFTEAYVEKLFVAEGLLPPSPAHAGIRTYDELRLERDTFAGRVEVQARELDRLRREAK